MDLLNKILTPVYAQTIPSEPIDPAADIGNLDQLFTWITNLIMIAGLGVVVVMLALGFLQYVVSRGDKQAIDKAQQWVTYAAIGGVGLFLVFAIRRIFVNIFGNVDPLSQYGGGEGS
ncbi:hypothetical protein A3K34_04445 [candidate division WWE3 bacterium RIFOXYC1_FULL_40_10]|nr:MAG: hypothetical protein A3K58_04445 [candidate division WWE3 bacterium RIFOXYB1_FULL_40_22]OGC62092.1 MAG: hypothetical protein A3K37_04445 [candidate division WWE3 bacterium RIFOXYA1_FULL_40_11]OGC66475.1 MAG: hypothetical protein A3K34_04445 [candidate division WWE3 bacterium RIFOXYC1_FULL_40_10]OGC67206.1 MAG: hypothetical protein A2450_00015 [candidate division WWE3 bacterium RIFOXYC2_FULL_40_11]OGC70790.1 MAG: hypothetical protein A2602_03095 [candidate division WWE3 bacterium RIFOXYD